MPTPNDTDTDTDTDTGGLAASVLLTRLRQRPGRVGALVAVLAAVALAAAGLAVWVGW